MFQVKKVFEIFKVVVVSVSYILGLEYDVLVYLLISNMNIYVVPKLDVAIICDWMRVGFMSFVCCCLV